jgi:hypothetical protein
MAFEYFGEYMKIKRAHDQNHFPPEVLLEKYKNAFLEMAEKEKIENPEKCWQDALLDHNLLSEKKWALLDAHVMAFLTAMALTSDDWKNCTCEKNRDISNKSNMLLIVQSLLNNDFWTIHPYEIKEYEYGPGFDGSPEIIQVPLTFVGVKPRNYWCTPCSNQEKNKSLIFSPNRKTPRSSPVCKSTSTTTLLSPS